MKTFIKNMTREQLKKVITDNENLQNEVLELLQESTSFYVSDVLDALNLSDYSIDLYSYSYIKYENLYSFLDSVEYVQEYFGILDAESENTVKRLKELLTVYDNTDDESKEIETHKQIEALEGELKEYITNSLIGCYDFSGDDIIREFIDMYHENFENYYIRNNDYTKIYIMTEKTI
ncbi:hypothetical protein LW81_046 [Lactococcus phage LW81]|uniref:Uncharacterized protein n=1 Tax=Lactococcus phage LW81 TaxID=1965482 RepID=A0A1W6JN31_9CAUD|nr:hypothetical protein H1Z34_gp046 [Lactococcus phage LW81]ARM67616.1 hypothetical protein LW81_046 [Lactococcus phage LW81]